MRVILLKDIPNLGKKYEIKEVPLGYAKNYLLPKKMAKMATKENLKKLEIEKEKEIKKAEEALKKVEKLASQIDGQEVIIEVKVGKKGQLFERITKRKIAEKLKEMGFEIKEKQIGLKKPLKELGEFKVKVNFEHGLEAEINVIVMEEKSEK